MNEVMKHLWIVEQFDPECGWMLYGTAYSRSDARDLRSNFSGLGRIVKFIRAE